MRGPGKYLDWFTFAWNNYVMEMDRPRQREAVYGPVADAVRSVISALADPEWWRGVLERAASRLGLSRWYQPGQPWFHWQAFLLVFVAGMAVVVVLGISGKPTAARAMADVGRPTPCVGRARPARARRVLPAVGGAVGATGVGAARGDTAREFARAAGEVLARQAGDEQLAPLPLEVAEAFYRVRFGHVPLDRSQAEAVEQALSRLERAAEVQAGVGHASAARGDRQGMQS